MSFESANEAKTDFDNVYVAPTPHAYIDAMARNGYEIGEQASPYCAAAIELLIELNGATWPVQMLDIGCSYGMGSAFLKYGCSFDEMVAFFQSRAPRDYAAACEAMRTWLNVVAPRHDVRVVGLDSSAPAIDFAVGAGLLDGGVARDFERKGAAATAEDRAWFRSCNLMISTGAIGYITDRSLDCVLPDLGKDYPGDSGPFAVITILRMFDAAPIQEVFARHGLVLESVEGVRLPQRRFTGAEERDKVLRLLHERGLDTHGWESRGKHYADLYVAAPASQLPGLLKRVAARRASLTSDRQTVNYIRR